MKKEKEATNKNLKLPQNLELALWEAMARILSEKFETEIKIKPKKA